MRYRIEHRTCYDYAAEALTCQNQAYLLPRHTSRQRCLRSRLRISPSPIGLSERRDFYGNRCSYFAIQQPHQSLEVVATSEVEIQPNEQPEIDALTWEQVRDALIIDDQLAETDIEARDLRLDSPYIQRSDSVLEYARPSFPPQRPLFDAVNDLNRRIHADFTYDPQATDIVTPLSLVLEQRRGVCQDFAHIAIACLRAMGLPGRYISGYMETLPPPGQPKLRGADASHAWFAVWLPHDGWIDFDPTNDKQPDERYITTAWGRDYGDVPPLRGVIFGGGDHVLTVGVDVERIDEENDT